MFANLLPILGWTALAMGPTSDVPVVTKTVNRSNHPFWESSIAMPKLKGESLLVAFANKHISQSVVSSEREFAKEAEIDNRGEFKSPNPYGFNATATFGLHRTNIITGYWAIWTFTGGAHGMTGYEEFNYAVMDGKPKALTLADVFGSSKSVGKELSIEIVASLMKDPNAMWVQDGSVNEFDVSSLAWFLGDDGITFIIGPYLAGPYAAGQFDVNLPYKDLLLKVNPKIPIKKRS